MVIYSDFLKRCENYHRTKDALYAANNYLEIISDRKTWDDLDSLTIEVIEHDLFSKYLFDWGKMNRSFAINKRKACYQLLLETIQKESGNIQDLRKLRIESVQLDSGPSHEKVKSVYLAFRDFCSDVAKKQPTASAKILHIMVPNLFVIWDWKYVRSKLRLGTDPASYLRYLKQKQSQLQDLLISYRQVDPSPDLADLIDALETAHEKFLSEEIGLKRPTHEPITKLLDEFQVMQAS